MKALMKALWHLWYRPYVKVWYFTFLPLCILMNLLLIAAWVHVGLPRPVSVGAIVFGIVCIVIVLCTPFIAGV